MVEGGGGGGRSGLTGAGLVTDEDLGTPVAEMGAGSDNDAIMFCWKDEGGGGEKAAPREG